MNWKKALKGSLLVTVLTTIAYYIPLLIYEIVLKYLTQEPIDIIPFLTDHAYRYFIRIEIFGVPVFVVFTLLFGFLLGILKLVYDIISPEVAEKIPKEEKKKPKKSEEEAPPPPRPKKKEEEIPPPIPIEEFQSFQFDWSQ